MPPADTRTALLDATIAALGDEGLAGLNLEDVAGRAGLSRQTLYRHFGNREGLLAAAIAREEARLLAEVVAATAPHEGLRPALRAALEALLVWVRAHPLLDPLLAAEPEALLPLLTSGAAPVMTAARAAVAEVVATRLDPGADVAAVADLLARMMLSHVIDPADRPPAEVAAALTDLLVDGLPARADA